MRFTLGHPVVGPRGGTYDWRGNVSESLGFNSFLGLSQDTGPNGDTSATAYDSYARPTQTTSKTGAVTYYTYANSAPWTVAAVTNGRYSRKTLDGLGRTVKVETGTTTGSYPNYTFSTPASVVETTYDPCGCSPMGKTSAVSMPHANGAGAVWTTYTYDGLGRTTRQTAPDGAHKDYAYSVNVATLTDEAGKWKKYTVDALGNLKQVEEPNPAGGSWYTTYTYDLLNHLTGVSMSRPSGTQTRSFNYGNPPGLYLLSATNPETGTVSYSYTNGLLMSKTDAKNQQTQYSYDSYNRVTQVRHYPTNGGSEDTCQQVNFTYDSNSGFSYLWGRLATRSYSVCVNSRRTDFVDMYGYTQAGQVAVKRLRVKRGASAQADLDGTWTYDNEGKMTGITYPTDSGGVSGGTYTIGYNTLGQPTSLSDGTIDLVTGRPALVGNATYGPAGELLTITGSTSTGYNETRTYNSRLQLTSLNGVTFSYPGSNNGKISSQYDASSGETLSYQYDALNRLISATSSQGWSQGFNYDGFGNLTAKTALQGSVPVFSAAFDPATNRQVGISYDANGNQLTDTAGYSSLQYDVENRLVWAQKGNQPPANGYGYDPDNRRVYRATLDYTNDQWTFVLGEMVTYYGVGGQKLVSYYMSVNGSTMTLGSTGVPNVYFGSKLVRHGGSSGNPTTAASDRLGSFGSYYPYGEERSSTGNNTERFATYYRDGDTGLDYAVNRYYNSVSGRFMSADPYKATPN